MASQKGLKGASEGGFRRGFKGGLEKVGPLILEGSFKPLLKPPLKPPSEAP